MSNVRDERKAKKKAERAVDDIIACFLRYQTSFGLDLTQDEMKREAVCILRKFAENKKGEEDE